MKKKNKRKAAQEPEVQNKPRVNFLPLIKLVISSAVIAGVYILCLKLEFWPVMIIYAAALAGLFAAFIILNGGLSSKPLGEGDGEPEYVKHCNENKKKAKGLLIFIIPLLFTVLLDNIYLNFIKDLIK